MQSYVEGEVATIKSNVASVQATLQNNIDLVKGSVHDKLVNDKVYVISVNTENVLFYTKV